MLTIGDDGASDQHPVIFILHLSMDCRVKPRQ
jgi:hypothetical protein